MRFHDKNTAVHLLNEGGPAKVEIDPESVEVPLATFFVDHEFQGMRPRFRKSIQFVCEPFFAAYEKAQVKLHEILLRQPLQKSGTLINSLWRGWYQTSFYDLETVHNGQELVVNGRIAIFASHRDKPLPRLAFYTVIQEDRCRSWQPLAAVQDGVKDTDIIHDVLTLILFIKYCPIEIKVVAGGKKLTHKREKYVNKTDLPVEILDSTWFTTIVRSEGFGVGGHFRMQPFGPGLKEKKLIWIAAWSVFIH